MHMSAFPNICDVFMLRSTLSYTLTHNRKFGGGKKKLSRTGIALARMQTFV